MSKEAKIAARLARCRLRMTRGNIAVQVREFNRAQRTLMRSDRQRHKQKHSRALASLLHELAYIDAHSHGSGSRPGRSLGI